MTAATAETTLTLESCVVRDTASKKGRTRTVSPDKTSAKHLHYGRIILDAGDAPLSIETGGHETGFIVLGGSASIVAGGKTFEMGRYDALYTPRDGVVEVRPGSGGCDIAEISAPVDHAYPLQFVPFAEVQKDPGLHFKEGGASAERTLNVLFGKNIQAGRIMAGVTFSAPGNWTSWSAPRARRARRRPRTRGTRRAFAFRVPFNAKHSICRLAESYMTPKTSVSRRF